MKTDGIIVDTSAWIESFKKRLPEKLEFFLKDAIIAGRIVTSEIIILEVVQGCSSLKAKRMLEQQMRSLDILPLTSSIWEHACDMGFSLRKKGVTVPTVDVIIASLSIENQCTVLHKDSHFDIIAKHFPLQIRSWQI